MKIWGLLHKTFTGEKVWYVVLTGVFCLWYKVNGKFMPTGVFRFYRSFFSGKVLCNRPQECLKMCHITFNKQY